MIERADLDAAVEAKLLTAGQRDALAEFVRTRHRATLGADEEQFRFITSFNDIFVTIAIWLLLFAVGALASLAAGWLSGLAVAATSWALAEYFTLKRRMAFPSIVLLITFAVSVLGAGISLSSSFADGSDTGKVILVGSWIAAAALTAGATVAHWRRFHVPISVAVGAAAASAVFILLVTLVAGTLWSFAVGEPRGDALILSLTALCGLGVFALAMRYDISDRSRETRRTDIAFWLHLLAAPMIIHPVFVALGLFRGDMGVAQALAVVALYGGLTVIALAIDRRAILVSALGYVIFAIQTLFRESGGLELDFALTALVLGGFLVLLSAGWKPIRAAVVTRLPGTLAGRLPVTV